MRLSIHAWSVPIKASAFFADASAFLWVENINQPCCFFGFAIQDQRFNLCVVIIASPNATFVIDWTTLIDDFHCLAFRLGASALVDITSRTSTLFSSIFSTLFL
jgi:hypothetical protein